VVIVIFGVLAAIAIPSYNDWRNRENAKKDINVLYSLLQSLREKAFVTKQDYTVEINGSTVKVGNVTYNFHSSFNATNPTFKITSRGTFSRGTTIKCNECYRFQLPYNCIVITNYNLRVSKCP